MTTRGVPGTDFWNGGSTLKQYFVLPKNGSKYYLKYTFLIFPVLGILCLGTPLMTTVEGCWVTMTMLESNSRNPKLCVCVIFVDCLPVVKGGAMFDAEEAPSKGKKSGRGQAHSS